MTLALFVLIHYRSVTDRRTDAHVALAKTRASKQMSVTAHDDTEIENFRAAINYVHEVHTMIKIIKPMVWHVCNSCCYNTIWLASVKQVHRTTVPSQSVTVDVSFHCGCVECKWLQTETGACVRRTRKSNGPHKMWFYEVPGSSAVNFHAQWSNIFHTE